MASGRQPEDESLSIFGYSIHDEFPLLQDAPLPAGAPLLSDNEKSALDNWLQIFMGNDSLNQPLSVDPVHSENWNDMPPQFLGSSTSYGPSRDPVAFPRNYVNISRLEPTIPGSHPSQQPPSPMMPSAPRSNSTPTLSIHNPLNLGHHFSSVLGAGHNQMLSEEEVTAANALMQNSYPASRHASFNYQGRPNLIHPYHDNGNLVLPNELQTMAPPHVSPEALLQASSHTAGPRSNPRQSPATPGPHGLPTALQLGAISPSGLTFPHDISAAHQAAFHDAHGLTESAPSVQHELQWGTDNSFVNKQFIARSAKDSSDVMISRRLEVMECLEVAQSANTTRAPSPAYELEAPPAPDPTPFTLKTRTTSFIKAGANADKKPNEVAPPRKRRKGKGAAAQQSADADDEESSSAFDINGASASDYGNNCQDHGDKGGNGYSDAAAGIGNDLTKNGTPRKRKAKVTANGHGSQSYKSSASPPNLLSISERPGSANGSEEASASVSTASAAKRRRSAAAQAKQPRENLTEEQKRENHIKSEQKRRTLIKSGFEDLCILVPGLDGGSHSKSTILTIAANYLEELLEGNKQLRG